VFVTGLEEEMFPYKGTRLGEQDLLDEERRLAYVAITRARKQLTLSFARSRQIFGTTRIGLPSRFLREIPGDVYATPLTRNGTQGGNPYVSRPAPVMVERSEPREVREVEEDSAGEGEIRIEYDEPRGSANAGGFRKGMRVKHEKFGVGRVESVEPQGSDLRLTVYFPAVGQKRLMAGFVRPV